MKHDLHPSRHFHVLYPLVLFLPPSSGEPILIFTVNIFEMINFIRTFSFSFHSLNNLQKLMNELGKPHFRLIFNCARSYTVMQKEAKPHYAINPIEMLQNHVECMEISKHFKKRSKNDV